MKNILTMFSAIGRRLTATESDAQKALAEATAAHERIALTNTRVAQIEHYLGLREHKFAPRDARWKFNQVRDDLHANVLPVEHDTRRVA